MRRRSLIVAACAPSVAVSLAGSQVFCQPAKKLPRVGLVFNNTPVAEMTGADPLDRNARAFVHGLRDLGLVEGRDIAIERRSAQGHPERGPDLLRELVDLKVDVLVTTGGPLLRAGKQAVERVPVVVVGAPDPVASALVASLSRPGGNITGLVLEADSAIGGKRLELLKMAAPDASRIAMLIPKPFVAIQDGASDAAARALGLTLTRLPVDTAADFDKAFASMVRAGAQAIVIPQSGPAFGSMGRIIEFAARNRLPAIYGLRDYVVAGGLMSYGTDIADQFRRAAAYVAKILKGTKPGDLPLELPTRFELLINLKVAKAMGLAIPRSLLLRAEEVIE